MSLTPFEKFQAARSAERPTANKYINKLFFEPIEFHGDRYFADDQAITAGVAFLPAKIMPVRFMPAGANINNNIPVSYIGIERGCDTDSRIKHNFGSPRPEGYRKALRLMKQAEKFNRPVINIIDTSGAHCGIEAEERGQGQAIANNLLEMADLRVPIIAVIIGEGGSGGALGLALADRVYMLENSMYSVISPEGCASILWKDLSKAEEAAHKLCATAEDMLRFKVADQIVAEDFLNFDNMCEKLRNIIIKDLLDLIKLPKEKLLELRYNRFRQIGLIK